MIGVENACQPLIQAVSNVNQLQLVTCVSLLSSSLLSFTLVLIGSFVIIRFILIGRRNYFGFGLTTLFRPLSTLNLAQYTSLLARINQSELWMRSWTRNEPLSVEVYIDILKCWWCEKDVYEDKWLKGHVVWGFQCCFPSNCSAHLFVEELFLYRINLFPNITKLKNHNNCPHLSSL